MVKVVFQMRIFLVHIIYIIYSGFLWKGLYDVSMATHYQEIGVIISLVLLLPNGECTFNYSGI